MEPARLPLDASAASPESSATRPVSAELWAALAHVRADIAVQGRLRDATIAASTVCEGCCFEVKARFVRLDGLLDERLWFISADDVRAIHARLGSTPEVVRLLREAGIARA
jgi:hypothetical protein